MRWFPFQIHAGRETKVDVRLPAGIRQRFEFVRKDGIKPTKIVHSLRHGKVVLTERHYLYWDRPPVYDANGAIVAELWLAPGHYTIQATEKGVAGEARFEVKETEGPVVRVSLR